MKCPYCGYDETYVIDSRPVEDDSSIKRRRSCEGCKRRFNTYERVETIPVVVIKKDDSRQAYDRSKIETGVIRACSKRPVSSSDIASLVNEVEIEIFDSLDGKEIHSDRIGEIVMRHLMDFDAVAYVRFASVYRDFKDVDSFMAELKRLQARSESVG